MANTTAVGLDVLPELAAEFAPDLSTLQQSEISPYYSQDPTISQNTSQLNQNQQN